MSTDVKTIISELRALEVEVETTQRKIKRIILELENLVSDNNYVDVFNDVIKTLFRSSEVFEFVKQSEIFNHLCVNLPNHPVLNNKCISLGWKQGTPSNSFWRNFWQYLAGLPNVKRVIKSKNDIRFYGIDVK